MSSIWIGGIRTFFGIINQKRKIDKIYKDF